MPGLDRQVLRQMDGDQAIENIKLDVRSDFILAPHFNAIYVRAADELWEETRNLLSSGRYSPSLPITMNVPKENWFSRPGSILNPIDRVVYQVSTDLIHEEIENSIDRERSFSHVPSNENDDFFIPSGEAWTGFQARAGEICDESNFVLKADLSHYFERIPQHHLINLMSSVGCDGAVVKLMEEMFLAFQERNSYGIIQGVFPSDIFGNFFLTELDAHCELSALPSARYVDDLYIGFDSLDLARDGLMSLVEKLRRDGLHLNEGKSRIYRSDDLIWEESAVDRLFNEAREEIQDERDAWESSPYGFEVEWESEEDDPEEEGQDIEVFAVKNLLDAVDDYPESIDQIERFALPVLKAAGSNYAIDNIFRRITERPHQSRLYFSYLADFVRTEREVSRRTERLAIEDRLPTDHQKLFLIATLMRSQFVSRDMVNKALSWLQNPLISKETRAMAAIFSARRGNANQKRTVRTHYEAEAAEYVRSAILYSARYFETAEKRTCKRAWAGHTTMNRLIGQTI